MRVAVIGCGIGGMAAAIALSRKGVAVTVFEAFDTPRPLGSGLLLQPSGLAALRSLGLEAPILEAGSRIGRLEGRDLHGRVVLELDYRRWRKGGHGVGIHRAVLFDVLYGALGDSGAELVLGARIRAVEDHDHPRLVQDDGATHGPFDAVIIADGSASTLRDRLKPRSRSPVFPWGAVWANCPDPDARFDGALMQVYRRAEMMIGVLPVGRGPDGRRTVSLFWSLRAAEIDAFFAGDFEAWKEQVVSAWPATGDLLRSLSGFGDLSPAVYREVSIGDWRKGACVIIGDAAHGTSPQLGQGANMALVDGVELAEHLFPGVAPSPALARYQHARRRHLGLYQLMSRAFTPLFQSDGGFWSWVRDWIFAPVSRLPGLRALAAAFLTGTVRLGRTPDVTRP